MLSFGVCVFVKKKVKEVDLYSAFIVVPSRSWIVSKRLIISTNLFHHRVAEPFQFLRTKRHGNILTGTP